MEDKCTVKREIICIEFRERDVRKLFLCLNDCVLTVEFYYNRIFKFQIYMKLHNNYIFIHVKILYYKRIKI